ncbi:EAL domain-containing protein [Pseudomonas sp. CCNWLW23]|uniref:EAL domain-containing protein n=1 Tax=Pseudomonas sp. CCNWLW23 TaxID=3126385 RepID=UPI00301305A5
MKLEVEQNQLFSKAKQLLVSSLSSNSMYRSPTTKGAAFCMYWLIICGSMGAGVYYCSEIIDLLHANSKLPPVLSYVIHPVKLMIILTGSVCCAVAAYKLSSYYYQENIAIAARFKKSLHMNDLSLKYQPIVDARTGLWIGAEALLRWKHKGKDVPPSLFISAIENTEIIADATRWVCTRVVEDYCTGIRACNDFYISINLSSRDVMDPTFPDFLSELIHRYNAYSINLMFEITENVALDEPLAVQNLKRIRSQGHKIALDDFGTGYSSFSYINTLPLDKLKIDRVFLSPTSNETNFIIIEQITCLAKRLDLDIIVEGIEEKHQSDKLLQIGIFSLQGWLYSKAISPEELVRGFFSKTHPKTHYVI